MDTSTVFILALSQCSTQLVSKNSRYVSCMYQQIVMKDWLKGCKRNKQKYYLRHDLECMCKHAACRSLSYPGMDTAATLVEVQQRSTRWRKLRAPSLHQASKPGSSLAGSKPKSPSSKHFSLSPKFHAQSPHKWVIFKNVTGLVHHT